MNYKCIEECYPGHLVRVGDVVGEEYAFPRSCFIPVAKGTEIEVPEEKAVEVSNAEIQKAKANVPIAGEPEKKVVRRRTRKE